MYGYILKRMLLMIPTLIGIVTITFVISEFVPGGPVDQIRAMLEGHSAPGAGGEVAMTGGPLTTSKKKLDPKLEMRLKRIYGLNLSMAERYLRMLLWFGRDSIISSREVDEGTTEKFVRQGRNCIILRLDDRYYAYHNSWKVKEQEGGKTKWKQGEVVFDQKKKIFRSVLDGTEFDYRTGAKLNGEGGLRPIQLVTEPNQDWIEIYARESAWEALTNYDNWHGFFLLKFGRSILHNKTVLELVKERLPVSISLGVFSFFISYTTCILLGIAKAVRNGSPFDSITSVIILFGYSIPGFVLAVLLIVLFGPGDGHIIELIPISGLSSAGDPGYQDWSLFKRTLDYFHHLVAPIICLSIGSFAVLTILTKNSVLEEFHRLYAVAARARGLSERKVLYKHILRNSLIPLATGFPTRFLAMFFTGALLIEQIFSLDGIGLLGYTAVMERDFPVIMGSLFVFTMLGLASVLLRDICYVIVDPRITFDKASA